MGIFNKKPRKKFQPSRKHQRKEQRKQKKLRKNEFFGKKKIPGQFVLNPDRNQSVNEAADFGNTDESPKIQKTPKSKIKKVQLIARK